MPITYKQANNLLNYNFGSQSYTLPSKYWIALSTQEISADSETCQEPVGNGYARVGIDNNKTTFSTSTTGQLYNLQAIQFPESTGNWGTITYVAIFDAETGGNLLYYDALAESRVVENETTLRFDENTFVIQLS